jgi:hypothetical protein
VNRNTTIQRIIAFVLLVIFTISLTPESFFHAALAKHTDSPSCTDGVKAPAHFHQKTYECHFDHLVVTASYFFELPSLVFTIEFFYPVHSTRYYCSYKQFRFNIYESRGPPTA